MSVYGSKMTKRCPACEGRGSVFTLFGGWKRCFRCNGAGIVMLRWSEIATRNGDSHDS